MRQVQLICRDPSRTRAYGAQAALGLRAAEALDAEAAEESRSGRELAALLAARLDAARRASEKLLGVLQARPPGRPSLRFLDHMERLCVHVACKGKSSAALPLCCLTCSPGRGRDILLPVQSWCEARGAQALAAAEAAYTRALTAASRVALAGECDGAAMCAVAAGLADLPFQVGQQHAAVGASLSDATRGVQARTPAPRWGGFCLSSLHHFRLLPVRRACTVLSWQL